MNPVWNGRRTKPIPDSMYELKELRLKEAAFDYSLYFQSSRTGTDFTADSPPDANLPFIQVWDQLLAAHRLVTPDGFVSAP